MKRRRRRRQEERKKKLFLGFFCVRTTSVFARFQRTLYFLTFSLANLDFLICRMREKKIIFCKISLFFLRGLTGKSPTDLLHPPPAANLRNSKSFSFHTSGVFLRGKEELERVSAHADGMFELLGRGMSGTQGYEVPGIFPVPQLNYMQISSQKLSAKSTYISYNNVLVVLKGIFLKPGQQETN